MKQIVLAIDQGTTGTTASVILFREANEIEILGSANTEFRQIYPQTGWVEHDLEDIWKSVEKSVSQACQKALSQFTNFKLNDISAIGLTNQRETLAIYDRKNSKPIGNAIVWQCRRSMEICQSLEKEFGEKWIRDKTGLLWDPYFTASKLKWICKHQAETARKLESGEYLWSTIDSFLLFRLTGLQSFKTEPSNASRTLLYDINVGGFTDELKLSLGLKSSLICPEIQASAGHFGQTKGLSFLPDGIPITGILGDQQAALAGQGCINQGNAKCTFGTGAFLLVNTGPDIIKSQHRLLSTVAWQLGYQRTFALEGSSFIAGAAVQFLRDNLKLFPKSDMVEEIAKDGRGAPHLYLVPAFVGLGAPHWNANVKGALLGLSRGTSQADISRATLEGIAFLVNDLAESVFVDLKTGINGLKVDGGACKNNLLMQIQANLLGLETFRPKFLEATSLGAGLFAALGAGILSSLEQLPILNPNEAKFSPESSFEKERDGWLKGWRRAVKSAAMFSSQQD